MTSESEVRILGLKTNPLKLQPKSTLKVVLYLKLSALKILSSSSYCLSSGSRIFQWRFNDKLFLLDESILIKWFYLYIWLIGIMNCTLILRSIFYRWAYDTLRIGLRPSDTIGASEYWEFEFSQNLSTVFDLKSVRLEVRFGRIII